MIEITNAHGPDHSISDDDIKNYKMRTRRYRNRRIGDFLKELHLVEGRNTGIPTALKAIRSNGSPLPIFLTDDERSFFSVILPIHSVFKETKVSSTHNINRKRTREELREDILLILKKDNKTAIEIYKDLGYTGSTSKTFRECLNQLIEEDRVCRIKEMNPPYRYLFQLKNKIVKQ